MIDNGFHLIVYLCLYIPTSLIVIVIACVEVECSAIVFYSNESVDLEFSFGRKGMIGQMDEMVIGL